MEKEFIELFKGYEGDFGIADMSNTSIDSDKNKIKPNYEWAGRPITEKDYLDHYYKLLMSPLACQRLMVRIQC